MNQPSSSGFTWKEIIIALVVLGVLVAVSLPTMARYLLGGCGESSPLSNMKQIQLATQQMALDGTETRDTNIGWPGDIGGTFTNWATQLVDGHYLSTNDLGKLLSTPGRITTPRQLPLANTNGVLVYAVSEKSDGSTVFLSSANFTNTPTGGLPPEKEAKPYGQKGFVVFHKAGDGAILSQRQAGDTNLIGAYVPLCR